MKKIDLVVTRHPGLVEYLRELGLVDENVEVINHASPEVVAGHHVCGVLPHSLSCMTSMFTEIPLNLPAELRGKELTLEDMRQYSSKPITYKVKIIKEKYKRHVLNALAVLILLALFFGGIRVGMIIEQIFH